jgi:hypothetical protein
VAYYLTIPEVTEAEEIVAFNTGSSDHSFDIVINAGETATRLFRAAADGTFIPLVVVVADGPMIALDDVVVSAAASGGSPMDAHMTFTLDAQAVRFV